MLQHTFSQLQFWRCRINILYSATYIHISKKIFWRRWKTKQLQVHIEFGSIGNTVDQQLFGFPPSSKSRFYLAEERNLSKWMYKNKTLTYFNYWVNYPFNVNKTSNTKRKIPHYSWLKNFNTVSLIGINLYMFYLYICSFSFLNAPAKYTYCTWN